MDRRKLALGVSVLGLVAIVAIGLEPLPARAQIRIQGNLIPPRPVAAADSADAADSSEAVSGRFPAPDRATLQTMNRAREALKQGRYGETIEGLIDILRASEDFFFQPDKNLPLYRSLKGEARRLIGQMPREGLDLYEVRAGAEARELLKRALTEGDPARLAEVSGQYFHTRAGYEATYLLGQRQLDQGSPLAAALTLKRLLESPEVAERFEPALSLTAATCWLQAGMPDEARRVLASLRSRGPNTALRIAGQEVRWFKADEDAVAWLTRFTGVPRVAPAVEADQWAMHRGDPARNAAMHGGAPMLNIKWRIPVADDHGEQAVEEGLGQLQNQYREGGTTLLPALHPLAIDDVVLMRTTRTLVAVDFVTGKRLWQVPTDDPIETTAAAREMGVMVRSAEMPRNLQQALGALGQRIWDDAAYGTLSSDGRLVYSIEDLTLVSNVNMGFVAFGATGRPEGRGPANRLAAHDIKTGKLKWELGGNSGAQSLRLAGTFFLGPPLPLRNHLYVLGENKEEIRLIALEAATGNVLWSQRLTSVERNVQQDPMRRLAGVSPSYSDGVLVCPTGAGSVVAVDLATRALMWGYRIGWTANTSDPNYQAQLMARRYQMYSNTPIPRWLDGTAVIKDGRVLVTPVESDSIACLNLADGKLLWGPLSRQDSLYLACVNRDKLILMGRQSFRALRVEDGKPAWNSTTVSFPAGVTLAGRGFVSGGQYFIPLSSAEVMSVDLASGKIAQVVKSRKGCVPGNLICHRGRVISQGLDAVDLFFQGDAAREEVETRLAANPQDVEAITLRGEILLNEGKTATAEAELRHAYELARGGESAVRVRELLREVLLEGLRNDFAGHRQHAADIEKLLDDPGQRAMFVRLMAEGFHQAGDWREALKHYLTLVDLDPAHRSLETVDRSHLARRDCWVRPRLAALRREGGAEAAAEIDRTVQSRMREAMAAKEVDSLRRFLGFFGDLPGADEARRELCNRLVAQNRLLDAELIIRAQSPSSDQRAAGAQWAELAEMFTQAGRHDIAAECYTHLARQFAEVVCRDGKTGRQILEGLAPDAPARKAMKSAPVWPTGEVEVKKGSAAVANAARFYNRFSVLFANNPDPFFSNLGLRFDLQGGAKLIAYDGIGREQGSLPLSPEGQARAVNFGYNPNSTLARPTGHIVFLSMNSQVVALDPAGISGRPSKLLWSQDLNDTRADTTGRIILGGGGIVVVNNQVIFQPQMAFRMNPFGPITARLVAFQRLRNLVAVDPMNGESIWVRQGIPPNCEVFGDDEYVFVVPPDQSAATVYRAADGQLLGTRQVPRPKSRENVFINGMDRSMSNWFAQTGMATMGRFVLSVDGVGERELAMFDPWTQRALWPTRKFAAGSKFSLLTDEAVAAMEPGGRLVLIGLPDGRTIADVKLEPEQSLSEILLQRFGDQYFLLTHDARVKQGRQRFAMHPMPGTVYHPIRRGRLYALDRQGKLMWPKPVDIEEQVFLLNQSAQLPVLLLACQKFEIRRNSMTSQKAWVTAIDRRTGRVVLNSEGPGAGVMLDVAGNPEQKSVELRSPGWHTSLMFTDKPVQGPEPAVKPLKSGEGRMSDALLRAAGRAAKEQPRQP